MLKEKPGLLYKINFMAIGIMLFVFVPGCTDISQSGAKPDQKENVAQVSEQSMQEGAEDIIEIFMDSRESSAYKNATSDLDRIRHIVNKLGENGYPAVDSDNQINMAEAEQVIRFCEAVDAKEENKVTVIEVVTPDSFAKYDLKAKEGKVDVTRSYFKYEDGAMQLGAKGSYQAEDWKYTEDGYVMFSGTYYSEEQYVLTLSGAAGHAAFRVLPLDEVYRELNRKYLMPIGYERNNMFLVDWSEANFGNLNFYDLYDIFYPMVNGQQSPYVMDDNLGVGAVYRIPKDEFEKVIMAYFHIDSETLQSKTTYYPEDAAYEYKPRGFYDGEYPEHPYPEVVAFTENGDGTMTLTVHVVFPYAGDSKVYAHEVVVRPLEDEGVQYVSNRIIPSADNSGQTWHTPRLTEETWEEVYGDE